MFDKVREFLRLESAASILLLIAAIAAMLVENSPLNYLYDALLQTPVEIRVSNFEIAKPLLLWINDGLMAVFFFLVGLELKREVLGGELSSPSQTVLPIFAAVGGMAVPAAIYSYINWDDSLAMSGWAIPAATDIAFALGVLTALGPRVPISLKIFLLTLAIIDDIGAIVIIAIFYSGDLSLEAMLLGATILSILVMMNLRNVTSTSAYILLGIVLWAAVLKSGVHATLAGVLLAFCIPYRKAVPEGHVSPLEKLEEDLHPAVVFGILPVFAFANSGVPLAGITLESFMDPVVLGIMLGLFLGKQIGIVGFSWLAVSTGLGKMMPGVRWVHIYGVSLLCGIGFTMSLFIGSLAFEHGGPDYGSAVRIGILAGSILSAVVGFLVLYFTLPKQAAQDIPADG
ncbi:MAG: Na+/H+ antiporter NhaA [Pseudomonadota bacterium]